MKSAYERIEECSIYDSNQTFKQLCKAILKNYRAGVFIEQKQLAESCFVSLSTISKLCKKLDFAGYKEMIFYLKIEYARFVSEDQIKNTETETVSELIHEFLDLSDSFLNTLKLSIKSTNKLRIFPSSQALESSYYLREILISSGYACEVIFQSLNTNWINNNINNHATDLLILFGKNDETSLSFLKSISDKKSGINIFLITSEYQKSKLIATNFTNSLTLTSSSDTSNYIFRHFYLNSLFFNFYLKLN